MDSFLLEEHMEKCEKEERFEEAATARDRILKLKRIENKRVLQDLEAKQAEDLRDLQNLRDSELARLREELDAQTLLIKENKEASITALHNRHSTEKDDLVEAFEAKYPNQPKFSPEVLNLQKIMDGHIKNRQYEQANETKIKILNLCEEQDSKHNSEIKSKKLTIELEKQRIKHTNEENALISKWDLNLNEFQKRGDQEIQKISLKYKNRIMDMKKAHISQKIEQEKINKKNLVIKPASLRKS